MPNLAAAADYAVEAARQGAEILLLPELFSTGLRPGACP